MATRSAKKAPPEKLNQKRQTKQKRIAISQRAAAAKAPHQRVADAARRAVLRTPMRKRKVAATRTRKKSNHTRYKEKGAGAPFLLVQTEMLRCHFSDVFSYRKRSSGSRRWGVEHVYAMVGVFNSKVVSSVAIFAQ